MKQLSATLKDISATARDQIWKSCRRGGGRGDRDVEESKDGAGSDIIGMQVLRQVMPRWKNDPLW